MRLTTLKSDPTPTPGGWLARLQLGADRPPMNAFAGEAVMAPAKALRGRQPERVVQDPHAGRAPPQRAMVVRAHEPQLSRRRPRRRCRVERVAPTTA
jgi:hypothetical protein